MQHPLYIHIFVLTDIHELGLPSLALRTEWHRDAFRSLSRLLIPFLPHILPSYPTRVSVMRSALIGR